MNTITYYKIGFHTGPGGNQNGIGEYFRQLDSAGIPAIAKAADDFGGLYDLQALAQVSGIDHMLVFRLTTRGQEDGYDYDVPNYSLSPQDAAAIHWQKTKDKLPPELDKSIVWIEPINEVDKNRSDWLGAFAYNIAMMANDDGYKVTLFGWSSGEPEEAGWEEPNMIGYLQYCAENPDRAAVSLHEYSLNPDFLQVDYPYLLGRFQLLHDVCDRRNISRPTIHITEFGWSLNDMADVLDGMDQLAWINEIYSQHHNIKGAAIWYLGGGWNGIANKAQKYIEPITTASLEQGVGEPPPDPIPPDPTPPDGDWELVIEEYFDTKNESGDDWYDEGNRQIRTGWLLELAAGDNPLGNSDGGGHDWQPFEALFRWDAFIPPHEQDWFLNERGYCYKAFSAQRPWAGRWKTPNTIQKGLHKIELVYVDDCYHDPKPPPKVAPDDPLSFEALIGIGSDMWSGFNSQENWVLSQFLRRNTLTIEIDNDKDDTRAWFAFRARWGIRNPATFVQSFRVWKWVGESPPDPPDPPDPTPPECLGEPRVQYNRVYLLIPLNYGKEWPMAATEATWDDHRYTIGGSADDAGIGALENRKVIAVNPDEWSGDLQVFMDTYYPGAVLEVINAATPEQLKEILLGDTPPDPPRPPTGNALLGLHGTADPGANPDGEAALFTDAKADVIKVLSAANPDLVRQMAMERPHATWIVRAFLSFGGRDISPQQFVHDTVSDVQRTIDKIKEGWTAVGFDPIPIWVELHNEPNLSDEGLGTAWGSGTYFNMWLIEVIRLYRNAMPDIKLMYPGLSPGHEIDGIRQQAYQFLHESTQAALLCDGVGAHAYWNTLPNTPDTMAAALAVVDIYISMIPNMSWWVTEASNNKGGHPDDKANEYIVFHQELKKRSAVKGVTYYISSASVGFDDEIWIGTDIAKIVGQR